MGMNSDWCVKTEMGIPAGKWCEELGGCPFLHFMEKTMRYKCKNMNIRGNCGNGGSRSKECLAAYPNGARVDVTPK